jgi:hypothetical protein
MSEIDDVWEHAQNVRMWLASVQDALGRAQSSRPGGLLASWLSRGNSRSAAVREAIDALGKARVAFVDLEFALHRACMPQVRLNSLHLQVAANPELGGLLGSRLREDVVEEVAGHVAADLATVDRLTAEVEDLQRKARRG